jgi:GcrA cell cycle regulator
MSVDPRMSLDDDLAKLWADGATLSEIERSTGITRGVAIGHIYRARKAGDPRFQPRPPRPPPVKARVLKSEPLPSRSPSYLEMTGPLPSSRDSPPPPPRPPPLEPRLLIDLDWQDCRWPVGQAPDGRHLMCGMPQVPGRPYCECHCRAVRSESTSQGRGQAGEGRWEI